MEIGLASDDPPSEGALTAATESAPRWSYFVDSEQGLLPPADGAAVSDLAERLDRCLDDRDIAVVVDGEPRVARLATAAAARSVLRARGIPGGQSLWWTLPDGLGAGAVIPGIASVALGRPRPHGRRGAEWAFDVLEEEGIRLVVLDGLDRVMSGPGSKTLRVHELRSLIRNLERTLFVFLGANLRTSLLGRPGADMIRHHLEIHRLATNGAPEH